MAIDFITSDLLWLGWRGVIRGGAGGRGGGVFGAGGGRGRAGGRGGELFYGDGDKVGGDVSDHHIFAARCHFRVPVRVSLCRHPFGFGGGSALIPRGDSRRGGRQLAFHPALARIFPAFVWGHRTVQGAFLPLVF